MLLRCNCCSSSYRALAVLALVSSHQVLALYPQASSQLSRGLLLAADQVPQVSVPKIDVAALQAEDVLRSSSIQPLRVAIPFRDSSYTPLTDGIWEQNDQGWNIWRLRVEAPNALHVNLGFTDYEIPEGGSLRISGSQNELTYTAANNQAHRELWTAMVLGSGVLLEVSLPPGVSSDSLSLVLTSINSGYREFSSSSKSSGSCNVDVICSEGNGWRDEIAAVALIQIGGSGVCTGTMINNAANDRTPYFLTAHHCGITSQLASTVVAYWNYETSTCGGSNGPSNQSQTGSTLVATSPATDVTLLRLNDAPDPAWNVHWAGWDRSGSPLPEAVAIHHPSGDIKKISYENDAAEFVSGAGSTSGQANGPYIIIPDWDVGTTEPGSSGSALFDRNHRIVGQLQGGGAACGNDEADWYGAFATSWEGGGTPQSRLRDWLDPSSTGVMTVDTLGTSGGPPPTPTAPTPAQTPAPVASPPTAPTASPPSLGSCFSAHNVVHVKSKEDPIPMTELAIGDYVKTCQNTYSPVYSFFHKHTNMATSYLRITTATTMDTPLEISRDHMLPLHEGTMLRAAEVRSGHVLAGGHVVLSVESVVRNGLYAPVTKQGTLIVSGTCVSSYVALWDVAPWIQNTATHFAMSVFRIRCAIFSEFCAKEKYDEDTGFALPYVRWIALIEWIKGLGPHVQFTVALVGAPFLWALHTFETTFDAVISLSLLSGIVTLGLALATWWSYVNMAKQNKTLCQM